jgi:hypothetical protein
MSEKGVEVQTCMIDRESDQSIHKGSMYIIGYV